MRLPPHAPVLARPGPHGGAIDVQVGLAAPVILSGLSFDERAFVATLEGGTTVLPQQARRFARVITRLTKAGAWETPVEREPTRVAIHGAGPLGMDVAALLHAEGMAVSLHDSASPSAQAPGTYGRVSAATCAGAAALVLSQRGIDVRVGGEGHDLEVIVCTASPDPGLTARLMRDDVAHVVAACDGAGVWLSHVIVPGVTACARCRDVALTRADPAWPRLVLQLAGNDAATRRPRATPLATAAAAARVGARAAAWLGGADPGVAESIGADGAVAADGLHPQPACGCGAAGRVGDEVAAHRARWR